MRVPAAAIAASLVLSPAAGLAGRGVDVAGKGASLSGRSVVGVAGLGRDRRPATGTVGIGAVRLGVAEPAGCRLAGRVARRGRAGRRLVVVPDARAVTLLRARIAARVEALEAAETGIRVPVEVVFRRRPRVVVRVNARGTRLRLRERAAFDAVVPGRPRRRAGRYRATLAGPVGGDGAPCDVTDTAPCAPGRELTASGRCERRSRVLVVGLDSGDWRYVDALIEGGQVPAMAAYKARAAWTDMSCVPARPDFACFCPIVWTSVATGWPGYAHGIVDVPQGPADMRKKPIWRVLGEHAPDATTALVSWRNAWPPDRYTTWSITEPGRIFLTDAHVQRLCGGTAGATSQWPEAESMPETWTKPPSLWSDLGLAGGQPEPAASFDPYTTDRAAHVGLTTLLAGMAEPPRLTMVLEHFPDKVGHVTCGAVHDAPFADAIDAGEMRRLAAAWTGPPQSCVVPGSLAGAYLEVDAHVRDLLSLHEWDYVLFAADHGMTFYGAGGRSELPCHHTEPPGLDGMFAVAGPGVVPGRVPDTNVLCFAPVLAYALGLPIAEDLPCVASGEFAALLGALFAPAHLAADPPLYVPSWE